MKEASQQEAFDIIVIGAGSGGLNIAGFMNRTGFKVLLVDKKEEGIGGDCLNYGCVPSKALIHIARQMREARGARRFGMNVEGSADMKKVSNYIREKKEVIRKHENKSYFESRGMTVIIGAATFASNNSIAVNGNIYSAKRILLATGSRPRTLHIEGMEGATILTNESLFDLEILPKKLLVIGGGPIGIELGQAMSHLGSDVSIVVKEDKILPREDAALSSVLQSEMEKDGVTFYFNSSVKKITEKKYALLQINSEERTIEFDAILVAVGRELNKEHLDLEKAGIELNEKGGIQVNEYLETTNKNVLLCGDIVGQHQFTHAAELHAALIIRNFFIPPFIARILPFLKKKLNTDHLSWVTYTTPELATFGISEHDLMGRNTQYKVLEQDFEDDDRAIVDETTNGKMKLFVSKKGVLLGGTMVSQNAGELVQELILVQSQNMNVSALFSKIYPYPTAARINKKAVSKLYIEKLTPIVKKLMKLLY